MADGFIAKARKLLVPGNAPDELQDAPVVNPDRDAVLQHQRSIGGTWPRWVYFPITGAWEFVDDDGSEMKDQSMIRPSRRS